MKHTLLLSIILLISGATCSAQNEPAQGNYSFGIYGGVNFQNINGKDDAGDKLSNSMVTKFHIGINEEIRMAPEFYFQIGLQFISKGTEGPVHFNDNSGMHKLTREINMNYIEMPLNLVFKPLLGTGNLILGFGPYVGYSIGGTAKFTGTPAVADADISFENDAPSDDPNNLIYYKHLDAGANFFVGYQWYKGLFVVFNSQLGMININSDTETKLVNKNTGFGLSLGYRI